MSFQGEPQSPTAHDRRNDTAFPRVAISGHKEMTERFAPGWPGILPTWTSSSKSGVGTSLSRGSRVWFTLSHGILNEIYYPRIDKACIRDLGLIVTDGNDFFSEEKRHSRSEVSSLAPGAPAIRLVN